MDVQRLLELVEAAEPFARPENRALGAQERDGRDRSRESQDPRKAFRGPIEDHAPDPALVGSFPGPHARDRGLARSSESGTIAAGDPAAPDAFPPPVAGSDAAARSRQTPIGISP